MTEVSCETCVAACCRAPIDMMLTKKEFKQHRGPMDLLEIVKPQPVEHRVRLTENRDKEVTLPPNYGLFELQSGCGNLTDDHRCSIYRKRPQCCRELAVGSPECLRARRRAGLDGGPLPEDSTPNRLDPSQRLLHDFFPEHDDEGAPPPMARPELPSLDAVAALVARNGNWIVERLAACDTPSWGKRTRCGSWRVGALGAHLVDGQLLAQRVLAAAFSGQPAETPPAFRGDQGATVAALTAAKNNVVDAITRLTPDMLEREVVIDKVAVVTVEHLVSVATTELAVHGLDLADALGETRHLTTDESCVIASVLPDVLDAGVPPRGHAAYLLRSLAFELPLTWRDDEWRCEPGPDPCWIEGEPEAVLLFALGRESFDESRLTTNSAQRARAFKRYLTGP